MDLSILLRILILLALVALIFQRCTRKKKPADNIEAWLEQHFPYRFNVLDTRTVDPIKNFSFQVKKSILADKTDSLLQIEVKYDKRDPGLGLNPADIEPQLARSRANLADGRSLFEALRSAGLSKVSASVWQGEARVLIFENPTPEARKQYLAALKTAFKQWPPAAQYSLLIIFMEPATYGTEFGDIVPLAHWVRPDSWQDRNTVLFLSAEQGYDFDLNILGKKWTFNTNSDKLGQWLKHSQPLAEAWAEAHLKKPVVMLNLTECSALEGKIGAQFRFPFVYGTEAAEDATPDGYITGNYLLDEDRLEDLHLEKE